MFAFQHQDEREEDPPSGEGKGYGRPADAAVPLRGCVYVLCVGLLCCIGGCVHLQVRRGLWRAWGGGGGLWCIIILKA